MTSALFMLRAVQIGISIADLDLLTIGIVMDMFTEAQNDQFEYPVMATQENFEKF